MNETITISMEEYKELLITKGKYEEAKSSLLQIKTQPLLKEYDLGYLPNKPFPETPYKITCKGE